MGERSIVEIADALSAGISVKDITYIDGTVYRTADPDTAYDHIMLPSYEEMKKDRLNYARSFLVQYQNTDPFSAKRLVEPYGRDGGEYVVQNPPAKPLSQMEMDDVYDLPYMRSDPSA